MEILITHLTDIHITEDFDFDLKLASLCKVFTDDSTDIEKAYLVISGDIANKGKKEEYEKATELIYKIKKYVLENNNLLDIRIVLVPGNHDCNFDLDSQIRANSIKGINYKSLGNDDSVLNTCISVQDDYWNFYSNFNKLPNSRLSYQITDAINGKKICFHCHNTAWMSQIKEKTGSLFFPVKLAEKNNNEANDINISVLHHPLNWFTPNSEPNNKKEFQEYLDKISSLHLIGHEHETSLKQTKDFDIKTFTTYFSGSILNSNDNDSLSGFQTITINTTTRKGILKRYNWDKDIYVNKSSNNFTFNHNNARSFTTTKKFEQHIDSIGIPLSLPEEIKKLSDIYIFPDIESLDIDKKSIDTYIDSSNLITNSKIENCILEGDSQIGKTSLLRMLFLEYYKQGYHPLLIDGKDIKHKDLDKVLKKKFSQTYSTTKHDYDKYKQLDSDEKILFIDNFQDVSLDLQNTQKIINQITRKFKQTIITLDTAHGMFPQVQADLTGFTNYSIKPFGYKKTNDLIVSYYSTRNELLTEKQAFLTKIKSTFDQVRHVLGNKIIPSHPIFLLSILQSLEYASFDLNETSYGYCYQTLIHSALANKANVQNDDLGSYINFIKELAYFLHQNEVNTITKSELIAFHKNYSDKFIFKTYETVIKNLLSSQIIIEDDLEYKFCYKYILYFLIAKHISDIIHKDEGKEQISELFENLHHEKNANILVFITHHTNDISFLNDSILSAMIPFEDIEPITLNKGGLYYKHIKDISMEISNDIIDANRIPEEEREKQLVKHDNTTRHIEKKLSHEEQQDEINSTIIPFLQAFRSIDIVGQIIKNRKGSLQKQEIIELISELYFTGFRTVGYLGTLFNDAKDILTDELKERVKDNDSREEINTKINKFFQIISMHTCLSVFTKLVFSVGIKDFKELYDEVAKQIGTPAAKLVSFSINSYYNEISTNEVSKLAKEFENNFVALQILKTRVQSYIYTNHVDYKKKQQLAQALNMRISASAGREKR